MRKREETAVTAAAGLEMKCEEQREETREEQIRSVEMK